MNIALINNFPPNSGAGRYAYSLYSAMRQYEHINYDMIRMNPMKKEDLYQEINKNVQFLNQFSYLEHPYLSRLLIYFINPLRIPSYYDLYHISNHMLGRFTKFCAPSVATVCDVIQLKEQVDLNNKPLSQLYNYLLKKSINNIRYASRIICISEWTKQELIQALDIDSRKVDVIHFGLNHNLFKPQDKRESRIKLKLPLDKTIVLHLGSDIPRKNVATLIKAFNRLKDRYKDLILLRVGEQHSKSTEQLIKELALENRIFCFEEVSEHVPVYYYNAADLFVFPSISEGFGLPALEAMACGCPVIASNRTSIPEVVGDGGILLDPFDVDALATKMQELLEDEDRRKGFSERGLQRAATFSWEECAKKTLEVYQEVVD